MITPNCATLDHLDGRHHPATIIHRTVRYIMPRPPAPVTFDRIALKRRTSLSHTPIRVSATAPVRCVVARACTIRRRAHLTRS